MSNGISPSGQPSTDEAADMKNHGTQFQPQQAENEDAATTPPATELGERVARGIGGQRNVGLEYMEALGYSKSEYLWTLKNIWGNIRPTER